MLSIIPSAFAAAPNVAVSTLANRNDANGLNMKELLCSRSCA